MRPVVGVTKVRRRYSCFNITTRVSRPLVPLPARVACCTPPTPSPTCQTYAHAAPPLLPPLPRRSRPSFTCAHTHHKHTNPQAVNGAVADVTYRPVLAVNKAINNAIADATGASLVCSLCCTRLLACLHAAAAASPAPL